jgi:hypothetical protein
VSTLSVQTITDVRSFDFANTEFAGAYDASNAAFASANASYAAQNAVFAVANAAFGAANNVGPQIAPAYNTANLAYNAANTSFQNTTGTFAGTLTVTGNIVVGTGTTTITSSTINVANTFKVTTQGISLPTGNTAQRPSSSTAGTLRFNSETGYMEQYTPDGWSSISTPPVILSVSPSTYNGESGTTFTLTGTNFDSAPVVKFITTSGAEYSAGVTTRVSSSLVTATTTQDFTVADEPLKVKIINASGLSFVLESAIDCGGVPAWSNASGSIGSTVAGANTGVMATVVATDPDAGATLSYSLSSGSLPSGTFVGSANGNIFGTTPFSDSNSTYSFALTASDNAGNQTPRNFTFFVERGVEAGGGLGWPTAASDATVANNITNSGMTLYHFNAQANSGNVPNWLNYSFGNFTVHTGHDGAKPTYLCFNLTSGTPRILNRFRWVKHGNACGNIDFYGSNQAITSDNFKTMSNWSYLGRGYMGGSGSAPDGNVMPAALNSSKYGYRWYMVLVRDIGGSLAYPSEGSMGGYAMYGATFDYVG